MGEATCKSKLLRDGCLASGGVLPKARAGFAVTCVRLVHTQTPQWRVLLQCPWKGRPQKSTEYMPTFQIWDTISTIQQSEFSQNASRLSSFDMCMQLFERTLELEGSKPDENDNLHLYNSFQCMGPGLGEAGEVCGVLASGTKFKQMPYGNQVTQKKISWWSPF